jgi:hypothetical protein
VALLGEQEVNRCVGSLHKRVWTEYLPLLASFVIAGDRFMEGQPGYALYNITDSITTTEIKPWFTRWLSIQKINKETTIFEFDVIPKDDRERGWDTFTTIFALCLGYNPILVLIACTAAAGDWPGIANFCCILISMLVRQYILSTRRAALRRKVVSGEEDKKKILYVTRQDGRMVTVKAPPSIVETFYRDCDFKNEFEKGVYTVVRYIGWLFFGGFVVIVGMSSLFTQVVTVVFLVGSTWFMCSDFGSDMGWEETRHEVPEDPPGWWSRWPRPRQVLMRPFGNDIHVTQINPDPREFESDENRQKGDRRMYAYAAVLPTPKQEKMLHHWSMLPFEGYHDHENYRAHVEGGREDEYWDQRRSEAEIVRDQQESDREMQKVDQRKLKDKWYDDYKTMKARIAAAALATPGNQANGGPRQPNPVAGDVENRQ